ncbi:MAG: ABC transporter permease [Nocardioides sp.]
MATGTFAPRPGAAPLGRQVLAQARMETTMLLRNGEQLLLAVVIPVIVLVGAVTLADRVALPGLTGRPVDELTPGVLALAVMSTAFTSLAIATGFERRYGVLKRLGASPLPRHGLLLGKTGALVVVEVLQFAVIGVVGRVLGWRPHPGRLALAAVVVAGTAAFAALGLLVAGVLRAEATLAAANLIYLLLLSGGRWCCRARHTGWGWAGPLAALGRAGRRAAGRACRRAAGLAGARRPAGLGRAGCRADGEDVPVGVSDRPVTAAPGQ